MPNHDDHVTQYLETFGPAGEHVTRIANVRSWVTRGTTCAGGMSAYEKRALPPNPYSCYIFEGVWHNDAAMVFPSDGPVPWTGSTVPMLSGVITNDHLQPAEAVLLYCQQQAYLKLAAKAKSSQGNWALNAWPSELKKTVASAVDLIKRLTEFVQGVRHLDVTRCVRAFSNLEPKHRRAVGTGDAAKRLGQFVLECRYAWQPLMQDIHDMLENSKRGLANGPIAKLDAQSKFTERKVDTPILSGVARVTINTTITTTVKARISFSFSNEALDNLKSLGLTNPADLAWELIPFSFIVDWFVPIGNFLENLDAYLGLVFHSGSVTTFSNGRSLIHYTLLGSWTGRPSSADKLKAINWNRGILAGFPGVVFPMFKDPDKILSPTHIENALALLTNAITGGGPVHRYR